MSVKENISFRFLLKSFNEISTFSLATLLSVELLLELLRNVLYIILLHFEITRPRIITFFTLWIHDHIPRIVWINIRQIKNICYSHTLWKLYHIIIIINSRNILKGPYLKWLQLVIIACGKMFLPAKDHHHISHFIRLLSFVQNQLVPRIGCLQSLFHFFVHITKLLGHVLCCNAYSRSSLQRRAKSMLIFRHCTCITQKGDLPIDKCTMLLYANFTPANA